MTSTQRDVRQISLPSVWIACTECDLLQREVKLPQRGIAVCRRCRNELYRDTPNGLDRTLAFALCGVILYLLANFFPLLGLELQGNQNSATLYGAVLALYEQKLGILAALVFGTTILVPGLELTCFLYILLPLRLGRKAWGFSQIFRVIQIIHPWGMIEVLMLGVLVSVIKLASVATVVPGIALWSSAGLMLMFSAVAQSFNPRDIRRIVQERI